MEHPKNKKFNTVIQGTETVYQTDGSIWQILAPESFVLINPASDTSYNIMFYPPDAVNGRDPKHGYFLINENAKPDVAWNVRALKDGAVISGIN